MATTTPDNIRTPDAGDQYALVQDLGALADSTQAALVKRANLYVGTSAQRTAFTSAPEGVHWQDTNGTFREYLRRGGAWVPLSPPGPLISGISSVKDTTITTVNFPAGVFSTTPIVIANIVSSSGPNVSRVLRITSVSTSSFNIRADTSTGGISLPVHWIALLNTNGVV